MTRDLLAHAERLAQERAPAREVLNRFRDLLLILADARPPAPPLELDPDVISLKRREGFPLFDRMGLPLDRSEAAHLLVLLLEQAAQWDREDQEAMREASLKAKQDASWALGVVEAFLKEDDKAFSAKAAEVHLDPEVLLFLAKTALLPSLDLLRQEVQPHLEPDSWEHGYCPLCGSEPSMAYLAGSGRRFLHCGLCGSEWLFPRIRCPFCDNTDHETLGLFQVEGEEGFRVDLCRKCRRYLKCVDTRKRQKVGPLLLEDLATLHLDVLAKEQGFS